MFESVTKFCFVNRKFEALKQLKDIVRTIYKSDHQGNIEDLTNIYHIMEEIKLKADESNAASTPSYGDQRIQPQVCGTVNVTGVRGNILQQRPLSRPRKTRRGKKKRLLKDMSDSDVISAMLDDELNASNVSASQLAGRSKSNVTKYSSKVKRGVLYRYRKMAPENSTQFIIDDHVIPIDPFAGHAPIHDDEIYVEGTKRDDLSFTEEECCQGLNIKSSPAYTDIDYEYVSPEDIDTNTFLERDFHTAYDDMRSEGLMAKSKPELVDGVLALEDKLSEVNCLVHEIEQLQEEKARLDAENRLLKSKCSLE